MREVLNDIQRRHDFVLLFDVQDGNPNGDPDAANLPRVDPETMHGLVTDVCLKRKVRNYVEVVKGSAAGYRIYVQNKGVALNTLHQQAYKALNIKSTGTRQIYVAVEKARGWMCREFYDVRTFGAVMSTGVNCGQVRGPVQMTFARSLDPVVQQDVAITRVAITKEEDPRNVAVPDNRKAKRGKTTELGRKAIIPYGLYRAFGFVNPFLAEQTEFSNDDLALFWQSLQQMWDLDRSAGRGLMACRALYVFTHQSKYGNAPADRLFSLITDRVHKFQAVSVPRSIQDYALPSEEDVCGAMTQSGMVNVSVRSLIPLPVRTRAAGV